MTMVRNVLAIIAYSVMFILIVLEINCVSGKKELQGDIDSKFLLEGIKGGFRISNVDLENVKCVERDNH